MLNQKSTIWTIICAVIILSILFISGCSTANQNNNPNPSVNSSNNFPNDLSGGRQGRDWPNRQMTNITDAQRQDMVQARQEQMTAACQGKAEGDSCAIQSLRGDITGSCKIMQNQTICLSAQGDRQMPPAMNPPTNP
jgi:hypothetical protein